MFREDDNFWKQILSFKGCGQNGPPPRWEWRKILLAMTLLLAAGLLIAAGFDSLYPVDWLDWSGGE